jgi:hypothetical protein
MSGSINCSDCLVGTQCPTYGISASIPCSVNTFSNSSRSLNCSSCPGDSYQPYTGQTACLIICATGFYSASATNSTCLPCSIGYKCPNVGSLPIICSENTYSNTTAATSCFFCELGSVQPSTGQSACLQPCSIGYHSASASNATCVACPMGTFCNISGLLNPTACPIGAFSNSEGASVCALCAVGSFCSSTVRVFFCVSFFFFFLY